MEDQKTATLAPDAGLERRIEDYALIGDCETAALVGRDGSIDWLCWPRFDSAACFASLLGSPENGRWLIATADQARVTRKYLNGSLILVTTFETGSGVAEIVDFMPPIDAAPSIIRIVRGVRGRVDMRMEFIIRFDYGSIVPWVENIEGVGLRAIAGPDMVFLRSPVAFEGKNFTTVAQFSVAEGESVPFVLSYSASQLSPPAPLDAEFAFRETESFWRAWADRCKPAGQWSAIVQRSLITLKGLIYQPTGGIVAAATTSLPEKLGSVRNWDYRYCWLRDATFTLQALGGGGFMEEAREWRDWLLRAVAGSPDQLQIMYGIAGERRLSEWEIPWLAGFDNSRPVRVGNAAHVQLQLDVYGEVVDAIYQARINGMPTSARWGAIGRAILDHLEKTWREKDEGIWEVRGPRQHFTHSKVMVWVAFDRAVRWLEQFGVNDEPLDHWRKTRDEIHANVCDKGFDTSLGSFTQSYGSKSLDASLLLLPIVGFLPPDDERIRGTVAQIEKRLLVDGLVYRYHTSETQDGLPEGEGAFLACSFWFVDNLILQDRFAEALEMFERLVGLCNDVGLLAEEYDPHQKRQLGNFPQAFSHVALVNTAYNLTQHGDGPAKRRAEGAANPQAST